MWHWVVARDKSGQPFLRGPYTSGMRAQRIKDRMDVEAEIIPLPTRDSTRATRMLKERRIEGFGLEEGTRKFKHGAMEGEIGYDSQDDKSKRDDDW